MQRNPPVTIDNVAQAAGVSSMTVSRALNNTGRVSPVTREHVLKIARDLNYVANFSARGLRGGRTGVLGIVLHDLSSQFLTEILAGASEATQAAGLELLLYATLSIDETREEQRIGGLLNGLADGLLLVLPRSSESFLHSLERRPTPVVLMNHRGYGTKLPTVSADNYEGARLAVEHLLNLKHRRVGFVTGDDLSGQSPERQRGYVDALDALGVVTDERLIVKGDFSFGGGHRAADQLLALPEPPTAIFAANDDSALGVITAAQRRGIAVPQQLSVIGFDDIPKAAVATPPLTTVRHPLREIGATAARVLINAIAGTSQGSRRVELSSELVVRESTAPPQS
jgi:LacI family transcriptional regulator